MSQAVTELCKGSSPLQLATLELDVQQYFKAPSFAALGHGSSLLQLCGQDEHIVKTVTSAGQSVAPLAQVQLCGQSLTSLYECLCIFADNDWLTVDSLQCMADWLLVHLSCVHSLFCMYILYLMFCTCPSCLTDRKFSDKFVQRVSFFLYLIKAPVIRVQCAAYLTHRT